MDTWIIRTTALFIAGGMCVLLACGTAKLKLSGDTDHTVSGGTVNTVSGETVTRIVVSIDFAQCQEFTQLADKENCMNKMLDILVMINETLAKQSKLPTTLPEVLP